MPELIVADSGPIISFARAGKLQLIQNLHQTIILPQAVYEEIVVKGKNKPGAEEVRSASWIGVRKPKNQIEVKRLRTKLGAGESEAVVLAEELGAILLADERIVIREARRRRIEITSSLLVLIEAKRKNMVDSVKEELDELIAAGFRTTPELVQVALRKAGE